jgi:hypothetical protein
MAKLTSILTFSGSLDGLSAYKIEGVEGGVLRRKGGPTRKQILAGPSFALTRKNNKETAGRSRASGLVLDTLGVLRHVVDQSCTGRLNAILKVAQESDTQSLYGQRHVLLSQVPGLLEGFALRKIHPLEDVISSPFDCTLDKAALSAVIKVPPLIPRINFFAPGSQAFYRVVASLGVVPDLYFDRRLDHYFPLPAYRGCSAQSALTDWFLAKTGAPATELRLQLPQSPGVEAFSLVLTVGVQWGTPGIGDGVDLDKKVKSARIEKVV